MKTIENKTVNITGRNKLGVEVVQHKDYFDLIKLCVNIPPKEGYDVVEMSKRLRILNRLKEGAEGKDVDFEDADYECIKKCVKEMRWAIIHKDIIDFIEYITNIK